MTRRLALLSTAIGTLAIGLAASQAPVWAAAQPGARVSAAHTGAPLADAVPTATPIKHLVVFYSENVSFDHYFATYPQAANPPGEPAFAALPATPEVDNLANAHLLGGNPNAANPANGVAAANPFRLDRTQANTADQNHAYTAEQQAYDGGKADLFPRYTGKGSPGGIGAFGTRGQVMGYFDGNTVTALWNYAQRFAMNDAAYTDTYGPSTPGALEVVAGQTNGVRIVATAQKPSSEAKPSFYVDDGQGGLTLVNDVDPGYDVCSKPGEQVMMDGPNVGDLLNRAGVTWGGFMGGFDLGARNANGTTGCKRSTYSDVVRQAVVDYIPHHNWFQYYASTANPTHARPWGVADIGYSFAENGARDPANHQYDLKDFYRAVEAGNFPAVSFVKMDAYQDGHAGYSDPLDEQAGLVALVNFLQRRPDWKSTAVIVTWDDSDGWYDHAFAKPTAASASADADRLDGPGRCGGGDRPAGLKGLPVDGRCGPGTRIPFLVISPWAKSNAVSHTRISQASVVRFIEDNWLKGARLDGGSFDGGAGSIMDMFDFTAGRRPVAPLILDPHAGTLRRL